MFFSFGAFLIGISVIAFGTTGFAIYKEEQAHQYRVHHPEIFDEN